MLHRSTTLNIATAYCGLGAFGEVTAGIADYMNRRGYRRVEAFRGKALR